VLQVQTGTEQADADGEKCEEQGACRQAQQLLK
jgi:hypothetical protein